MLRWGLASATFLASTSLIFAGPLEDADRSQSVISQQIDTVATALTRFGDAVVRQANALTLAIKKVDLIADNQQRTAPLIARVIELGDTELVAARREWTDAQRELHDADAAVTKAKSVLVQRRAEFDKATASERAVFEASAEFKDAQTKADAAAAKLDAIEKEADAALRTDPKTGPLLVALDEAEKSLATARAAKPVDDDAVATASARWLDAANAVGAVRAEYLAKHAPYRDAADASKSANDAVAASRDVFEKTLLTRPGIAEAKLALNDAVADVRAAAAVASLAKDHLARAGRWVAARKVQVEAFSKLRSAASADDATALQRDLGTVRNELSALQKLLADSDKRLDTAKDELKKLATAIDRAQEEKKKLEQAKK